MTLSEIKLLHAYNSWANNRIFDGAAQLPTEQYKQDMKSSHGGIHGTLTHIVGAEKIWTSRLVGTQEMTVLKGADVDSLAELKSIWEKVGFETAKFLGTMTDKKLGETFTMKTTEGKTYTNVYWQAFQHVVNHSTYHRGQIITMMRQLGVKPPGSDLIVFYRETGKLH